MSNPMAYAYTTKHVVKKKERISDDFLNSLLVVS